MLKQIILIIFSILLLIACNKGEKQPYNEINLEVKRFEKDIFVIDPTRIDSAIPVLIKKYDRFLELFSEGIIGIGSLKNPYYSEYLKEFVTDYYNFKLFERTLEVFPDLSELENSLNKTFSVYKSFFPEKPVPEVITYISGFNQSVVSDSNLLAIGLDKYLGTDEKLYDMAGIYSYLRVNMHKDKILSDCMRLWGTTEFEFNDSVSNLITNIVYEGMIMLFVDKILPEQSDTLKWGFTNEQYEFCSENEKQMWTYLIENKLLFNSDKFTIGKFINEGPFTKDFSAASPARAAVWIGYNIVQSYIERNNISFHDLMYERDYMKILNQSGYNP